MILKELTTF